MKTANSILKIFLVALLLAVQVHFAYAQTAALLPVAPQQFFDKNGNPVTSGSVGYYIPGTSTPKMVWQDDSQTTPWTNPITLNAGGWPPNNKGIYGNGIYRQIIKDKNNNIISDQPTSATGSGGGSGSSVGDGNSVGTILTWSGMIAPNQYQFAYGQALSRITFPELYQAITLQTPVTCVGGNTTLTGISDTTNIPIGANVEGSCIVAGSTVLSKTINTVTLSVAANISTTLTATFFPYGNGNGTTTFNAPDLRGKVIPGRTNMGGVTASNLTSTYYGSSPDATGAIGGNQSFTLAQTNLPNVNFNVSIPSGQGAHTHNVNNVKGQGAYPAQPGGDSSASSAPANFTTTSSTLPSMTGTAASGGSGTAFSLVQPSITLNYVIKVTPDTSISGLFGVASIGGMQGIIACGAGLVCAGNTLSASSSFIGGTDTQIQYNSNGAFAGDPAFIWVSPKLTIGLNGTSTGQIALAGATSGLLTQTVGTVAGTPIITWGNASGTPAVTASGPLSINTTTGNLNITGSSLTKIDDTNVTLTLGGSPSNALINATSLTLGWTGNLSVVRGGTGTNTFISNDPIIGNGTSTLAQGSRSGNTTIFGTTSGVLTSGNCVSFDANGNLIASGAACNTVNANTLTGTTLAANVVNSSLTGVGTISTGIWNAGAVTSSGAVTGTQIIPTSSSIPTNGIYLPTANQVGFSAGGSESFRISSTGASMGAIFGDSLFAISKNFPATASTYGLRVISTIPATASSTTIFQSNPITAASSFNLSALTHYVAQQQPLGVGSSVTTQYGFSASSSLNGAVDNYGFYGNLSAGSGRWNFYASGTARNFFNGNLGLASTAYLNWGTTDGASGQGIRQNAGVMQVANTASVWNKIATSSGTLNNGNCVSIDSSGNFVDAGGPCTTGGGGGTVASGTANQIAYYTGTGTTVGGAALNATATKMYLTQTSSGVPAFTAPELTMVDEDVAYGMNGDDSANNDAAIATMVAAIDAGDLQV